LNLQEKDEKSPLWIACCNGNLECIKILVQQSGTNLNLADVDDQTPY